MSKKRSRNKARLKAVASAVAVGTYLVLDAAGRRRQLSPMRWAQYRASFLIEPVAENSPIARVRLGYTVRVDAGGEAVVVALETRPQEVKLRSNFWAVFWRAFIYSGGGGWTMAELLRAIAEDHQQESVEVERIPGEWVKALQKWQMEMGAVVKMTNKRHLGWQLGRNKALIKNTRYDGVE